MASGSAETQTATPAKRDRTHWLYIAVIVAVPAHQAEDELPADDPDVVAIRRMQTILEQPKRPLGVRAVLHVDSNEGPQVARTTDDVVHERDTQLLGDVELVGEYRDFLRQSLGYEAGRDLLEFAYDFRQDNRRSAAQLGAEADIAA